MAENTYDTVNSKEAVAFKLLAFINNVAPVVLKDSDEVLDLYTKCLHATSGRRPLKP